MQNAPLDPQLEFLRFALASEITLNLSYISSIILPLPAAMSKYSTGEYPISDVAKAFAIELFSKKILNLRKLIAQS
ncbi:MAG: hypothetical protein ACE5HX_03405 [bacterium]